MAHPPPPRRSTPSAPTPPPEDPNAGGWKSKMKARGAAWGKVAMEKGVKLSDNLGGKVNTIAADKFGTEAFWPVTGDLPNEMEKCARILRSFTETGIVAEAPEENPEETEPVVGEKSKKKTKKVKVIRKIPPKVIQEARGLVIFTAFRSGIAPLGGAGGAGVVIARLPDGSWSAPSSVSPNNLSTGFLIGLDVYDAVLVLRTDAAVASFSSHKVTIGAELGVAAGPYGAGASVESGMDRAPIFSYVKSRGMYAGIEIMGQVFVERYDENGTFYAWTGVKAGDILSGKVKKPREAAALYDALADAESGKSQATPTTIDADGNGQIVGAAPGAGGGAGGEAGASAGAGAGAADARVDNVELREGEVLHLPPTPEQTASIERQQSTVDVGERRGSYPTVSGIDGATAQSTNSGTSTPRRLPPPIPARRAPPAEPATAVGADTLPPTTITGGAEFEAPIRPTVQKNDSEASHYSADSPQVVYDAPPGPPPVARTSPTINTEASAAPAPTPAQGSEPPAYAVEYVKAADGTDTTVHELQRGMEKTAM